MGNCAVESLSSEKGYAMINGGRYSFYRVHWHSPSENTVDGIPEMKGTHPYIGPALGLNAKLTRELQRGYYHWFGSLTTPPCTEGISWNLLKAREDGVPASG